MPRVHCEDVNCRFNEDEYCDADDIKIDLSGICITMELPIKKSVKSVKPRIKFGLPAFNAKNKDWYSVVSDLKELVPGTIISKEYFKSLKAAIDYIVDKENIDLDE